MAKHPRIPTILTLLIALVIDLLFVAFLFDQTDRQTLLLLFWGPSVILLPAIYFDGRQMRGVSWARLGGLAIPGVNLFIGIDYLYRRFRALRNSAGAVLGHGGLYFTTLFTGGLALVALPYLSGPLGLLCAFRIRTAYDRREGSLLLAFATVLTFFGLLINHLIFNFIRPGPIV